MIWKILVIKILLLVIFIAGNARVLATDVGQCATRNDCDDCPRKTNEDCACYCSSPAGQDPGCLANRFNGYPSSLRCVGDLSCPFLALCITPECTCTPGSGGGGSTSQPSVTSPPVSNLKLMIVGRVFIDNNRSGGYESGDVYVQSLSGQCLGYDPLDIWLKVRNRANGAEFRAQIDKCNPEPYFNYFNLDPGEYDVSIEFPNGWQSTTPGTVSVILSSDHANVVFGIARKLDFNCPTFEAPGKICLGENGLLKASSNLGGSLTYKWESGCLVFPNGSHVYIGENREVNVSPTSLGSCEVKLSASINGVDFNSCGKKYVLLDDCKVSCLSITSTPSIVKVGQSSEVEVTVKGEPPFMYSWATPISDCKIEGTGSTVLVTPVKLPEASVGNICPVSVTVNGEVCSTNIGVVEDSSYNAYSWFKTLKGDVFSHNSISDNIPINEFFSDYLVKSTGASLFDFSSGRTGRERASGRGWLIEKTKFSFLAPSANFFEYFMAYYPAGGSITKSEIEEGDFSKSADYLITPDLGQGGVSVKEKLTAGPGVISRFYVNGDLNINNDVEISGDGVVLFVVRRNLNIGANVKQVSGAFLVDGTVNVTDRLGSRERLTLNGLLAASSKGKLFGLSRNVPSGPSEVFIYEPKYLVKLGLLFNKPTRVWLEVSP